MKNIRINFESCFIEVIYRCILKFYVMANDVLTRLLDCLTLPFSFTLSFFQQGVLNGGIYSNNIESFVGITILLNEQIGYVVANIEMHYVIDYIVIKDSNLTNTLSSVPIDRTCR